jgi:uncharacterized membrane protein HdeD (DUF308 family)
MKTVALLVGIVLLLAGIACFIPGVSDNGMLFGTFPMSTPLAIAFIVTGVIGVMIGLSHRREHLAPPRNGDVRDLRDL